MIIYRVSVTVHRAIEAEWLAWVMDNQIPEVMKGGYFGSFKLGKVVEPVERRGATVYDIEFICPSMEHLRDYRREAMPAVERSLSDRYRGRVSVVRTVLEVIG